MVRGRHRVAALLVCLGVCVVGPDARAQVSVTTQHNNNGRTGLNSQETALTLGNVNSTDFGKLFSVPVDGYMYAQPLYLAGVNIANGVRNVVFAATEHNSVYAIDADTGVVYWHVNFLSAGVTTVPTADVGCSDLIPEIGITGTPVIDSSSGTLYVVAKTKQSGAYAHRLHALDVSTGAEKPGSPVLITGTVSGTGDGSSNGILNFDARRHFNRPGLLLQNGHVIVAFGSHCDGSPYHGWVMSYNSGTLAQEAVYNTTPNGGLGGIWMSGAGPASDSSFNTYVSTGNGDYNGNPDFGDSVLKLGPVSGTFPLRDWFTPFDQARLDDSDIDLGSGGVLLVPDQPPGSPHEHLLVTGGKGGTLYLIDRDNMGHFNSQNNSQIVQSLNGILPGLWGLPAWWNNRLYLVGTADAGGAGGALRAYTFNPTTGLLSTTPTVQSSIIFTYPGPTPAISSNGNINAIAWVIQVNQFNGSLPAVLRAFNATTLVELYNSQQNAARDSAGAAVKYTVPTIANGKVYVGTQTQLSVYGTFSPFSGLSLNPGTVVGGGPSTGTVTLGAPAPTNGITVNLTSADPSVVTVPPSVTIPAGATSATFVVSSVLVTSTKLVNVSGVYAGTTHVATLRVNPLLASLTLAPPVVAGGSSTTGAVQLNAPAPGAGVTVNLSSDKAEAGVPGSVTVPGGATTADFAVSTSVVTVSVAATITAALDGATAPATLTVNPAATTVSSVSLNPVSVTGGVANSTGTVTLNGSAPPGGIVVALASGNTAAATVPANVTVPVNASTATFPVTTLAVAAQTSASITATFNGTASAPLTVNPPPSFNPIRVNTGGQAYTDSLGRAWLADTGFTGGSTFSVTSAIAGTNDPVLYRTERWGTFTYNFATPPGTYEVTLKFAETSFTGIGQRVFNVIINGATVLANFDVRAQAGAANAALDRTFPVTSTGNIAIQFTPGTADLPKVDAIQIAALSVTPATVASVSMSPASLIGGNPSTGTVTLNGPAPAGGAVVALSISDPVLVTAPASVTVAGGTTSATFQALTVGVTGQANLVVTATLNGSATGALTVNPPSVIGLTLNPSTVVGGNSSTGTLTLNGPAPPVLRGISVSLTSSDPAAAVETTVTVPAEATSVTFPITTSSVTSQVISTISAILNGTASAPLTVTPVGAPPPVSVSSVSVSPPSVTGGSSSTGTVTLTGAAPAGGATVSLSSNNSAAQVPVNVLVNGGASTANFPVTTIGVASQTSATLTATYNGSATTTLAVLPAAALSLVLNPTAVQGGVANSTATITLSAPASGNTSQRTVTLSSNNTNAATVPASVVVPSGAVSANFTVTSKAVPVVNTPVITATRNGSATATLTVNPPVLASVTLNNSSVTGGATNPTGTVTLSGPAAGTAAQRTVTLASDNTSAASVPASVTVAAGSVAATFTVTTTSVASQTSATITATFGVPRTVSLTLNPPAISSLTLSPPSVTGGTTSTGTARLNAVAPAGGIVVALSSGNTSVATVASSVTVPAGVIQATFLITTTTVTTSATSLITATANGSVSSMLAVTSPSAFVPRRVNAGGPAYTDLLGQVWQADTGFSGGSAYTVTGAIANTSDAVLYRSERWGNFTYSFAAPPGTYAVTLKFAETSFTGIGQRVFNVAINGTPVLTNFDIRALAGGARIALDRTFQVTSGGAITIQFTTGSADLPKVDAIQIVAN